MRSEVSGNQREQALSLMVNKISGNALATSVLKVLQRRAAAAGAAPLLCHSGAKSCLNHYLFLCRCSLNLMVNTREHYALAVSKPAQQHLME